MFALQLFPKANMNPELWSSVDRYLTDLLIPSDPVLDAAVSASKAAGLPPHQVSETQGKLLMLLAQIQGARRILEIGTLGGFSTICLGRALPPGGRLITLELEEKHASVARTNLARAGLAEVVEVRVGPAVDLLSELAAGNCGPFDLIFIDADKANNPSYLQWSLRLSRPGTVIIADNVIRNGAVASESSADPSVQGIRRFNELLAAEPGVSATVIQTVGNKGYDGFALIRVTSI